MYQLQSILVKYARSLLLSILFYACSSAYADFSFDEVAEGVFVHYGKQDQLNHQNKGDISNTGFIVGSKSVAVIDTGGSWHIGRAMLEKINQVTDLPVRYVILTHAHPDHIFGMGAFTQPESPLDIVGHSKLTRAMVQRGEYYRQRLREQLGFKTTELQLIPQSIFVDKEMKLDLGDRYVYLQAQKTSHTDHDLIVLDQTSGTLWTGDVLFRERVPVIDGSILGWMKTIEKLQKMNVRRIIPGHGPMVTSWKEAFADQSRYFQTLIDEVRKSLKSGQSIQQAVAGIAIEERNRWLLFDDHHGQNVARTYKELEWE